MIEGQRWYARLTYRKTGRLRWLGHLDIRRGFERALRRSGLPVAYSQGYNPHIRLTFAHPLPVGVEGWAELCAVDLAREVSPQEIGKQLLPQLCDDLQVTSVEVLPRGRRSPFADLSVASYELVLSADSPRGMTIVAEAVDRCLASEELVVERRTKRNVVWVDIRPHIYTAQLKIEDGNIGRLVLELGLGEKRLVKPQEVVDCLAPALSEGGVRVVRTIRTGLR